MKAILSCSIFAVLTTTAHGASWTPPASPLLGPQCATIGINDAGMAIGNCTSNSVNINNIPWLANGVTHGTQTALAPLATGQPCFVWAITNNGKIIGDCKDASGMPYGVSWDASNPTSVPVKLDALPATLLFPLLRPKDKSTQTTAVNDAGDTVGFSFNSDEVSTAVYFPSGSGTPQRISDWNDNCFPADINLPATGNKRAVMNCTDSAGHSIIKVAEITPGSFSATSLSNPTGAVDCNASNINNSGQVLGTCNYPNAEVNVTKTTYWPNPAGAPKTLQLSSGSKNTGVDFNDSGVALVSQMSTDGIASYLIWFAPSPTPLPLLQAVILPTGVKRAIASRLGSNNSVALSIINANENTQGCVWTSTTGAHCLLPISGGKNNRITSMSKSGNYIAGVASDSNQNLIPVITTP